MTGTRASTLYPVQHPVPHYPGTTPITRAPTTTTPVPTGRHEVYRTQSHALVSVHQASFGLNTKGLLDDLKQRFWQFC